MIISSAHTNQIHANQASPSRNLAVAREFEALFTAIMMKSMRNTIPENGLVPKSMGEKIYTDILDMEYAKKIANNASFGLAEQIVKQIEEADDKNSVFSALQDIGNRTWMSDPRYTTGFYGQQATKPVSPRPVEHWNVYIDEASATFNVDRNLIAAVITQESAGDPYAVSRAGAKGLMQLMDTTARDLGVRQVFNPRENIMAGTRYLSRLLKECHGDITLALASYNAGPAAVQKHGGIPPYRETQDYVERVLSYRDTYTRKSSAGRLNQTGNGEE